MAGLNLEVFKFGIYVMFPIGIMYYFGTNLDNRFAVSGFWPTAEQGQKIPTEKEEIRAEMERLRAQRLHYRDVRLANERKQVPPPQNNDES
ncbi:hypothetical protein MKZ38_010766 [Zalerion maritima]|uniref:Mitochondrial cytochrome c oxidase assembly factor n=1 Tax=Zalerion maritima TaxID=339359 RepID=A0AAD5S039_9PEZI|nr:hypothetical protein MKZ38_010766 [Zalerion maritima]